MILNNVNYKNINKLEIKEFRIKHHITQKQLAKIVFQTERTVQSWEQGERKIPQSAIQLMKQYELTYEEKNTVQDVPLRYGSPSQIELMTIVKQQQEEIVRLQRRIIDLQDELLAKKILRDVKDA